MNMTVSYLDTLAEIAACGEEGLLYSKVTRAMKRHVMSLQADKIVAGYLPSGEQASLDTEGVVVCLTVEGLSTFEMYVEAGLVQSREALEEHGPTVKAPRKRRSSRKPKAVAKTVKPSTVPTPLESLEVSPVTPKGHKVERRIPGNQHGDQVVYSEISPEERMAALEEQMNRKFSALLAAIEANAS